MDRRRSPGLGVFSGEGGSKRITTYPVQVPVLRYSSACKTMFVPVLKLVGSKLVGRHSLNFEILI